MLVDNHRYSEVQKTVEGAEGGRLSAPRQLTIAHSFDIGAYAEAEPRRSVGGSSWRTQ